MLSVSNNFLRLGVLYALAGMSLGIWMGAHEDFTLKTVHAHINLLGFASMMLFGLFYRAFPTAARGWLPVAHFTLSVLGFLILMPTLTLMFLQKPFFLPGLIARRGLPKLQNIFVVHEGAVQRADGELTETDYDDVTAFDVDPTEGLPAQVTPIWRVQPRP